MANPVKVEGLLSLPYFKKAIAELTKITIQARLQENYPDSDLSTGEVPTSITLFMKAVCVETLLDADVDFLYEVYSNDSLYKSHGYMLSVMMMLRIYNKDPEIVVSAIVEACDNER